MKQSSVLIHSKVKKVLYKGLLITLSFHIHQLCTIWTKTQRAKCITVHSQCILLCGSSLRRGRSARVLSDVCVVLTKREKERNGIICLWDKAFPNCAYTLERETTKFPDMFIKCESMCSTMRWCRQARQTICIVDIYYYCYFHQLSDWITLWITIHYGEYVCQWKWTWRDCPGGNPNKSFNIMCCMSLVVQWPPAVALKIRVWKPTLHSSSFLGFVVYTWPAVTL